MKSLRSLISWSAFVLMAGLLLFSGLVYAASETLLQRFVDGRLLVLAESLADFCGATPMLPRKTRCRPACLSESAFRRLSSTR